MKYLNLDVIALALLVIGGLNAAVNAVFDYDAIGTVLNGNFATAFYALVGCAALWAVASHMGLMSAED